MIIGSIQQGFISVPNLEEAIVFYRDTIGLRVVTEGPIDTAILQGLWGLPKHFTARSASLRNTKQDTAIELVQLDPTPKNAIRDSAATYDHGFFHLLFLVPDSGRIQQIFEAQEREWLTYPYHFPPLWSGSEVIEGWAYGPAREIVAILEYIRPPVAEEKRLAGDFWILYAMGHCVGNMQQAMSFYRDALGLRPFYEGKPPPGFYDDALHLPKNTGLHVALVNNPDSNTSAIELFQTTANGKTLRSSPMKLGIFMLSFESDDLDTDIKNIQSKGFNIIAGPVKTKSALHGSIRAADIEGPDKVRIEIFEKMP